MSKAKTKTKKQTPVCIFCGGENTAERVEIDMHHCTHIDCVGRWRRDRIENAGLALVFVHKQGLMWIDKSDVPKNDMRRQGGL